MTVYVIHSPYTSYYEDLNTNDVNYLGYVCVEKITLSVLWCTKSKHVSVPLCLH